MKRTIPFLFFFLFASFCNAQILIKGIVIDDFERLGIPGAIIVEFGTENKTISDSEGNFELAISNPNTMLEISFIGFKPQKKSLKGKDFITVVLKSDCVRDFFDSQNLGMYALSGVLNTPIGGQLDFAFPNFSKGTLVTGFSLQTDFQDNNFFIGKAEYKHFIFNCDFDLDLNFYHGRINFTDFRSTTSSLETNFNYGSFRIIGGYSRLKFDDGILELNQIYSAPVFGLGTWINTRPVQTLVTGKVALFKNRTEINTRATFYTKYADLFINYYELGTFSEFTIGIGRQFGYLNKSQKRNIQQK